MISEIRNNIKNKEFPSFELNEYDQKYKLTPKNNITFSIDEEIIKLINISSISSNDLKIKTSSSFTILSNNYIDDDKLTIVLVEDNKLVRESTVNMLKNVLSILKIDDFRIIEGSDGIDLLNTVRYDKKNRIKYIFTDENMMYLNGSEAVRQIRKFEQDKKIPNYKIFSITAFDDEETKKNILDSGINSILSKPCSKSELLKIFK
jgi:CheY-like chemotaxis protein